ADHGPGLYVAVICAIENQKRSVGIPLPLVESDDEYVVDGVHRERVGVRKLGFRTLDNAKWCNVSVCFAGKDLDLVAISNEDSVADRIHVHTISTKLDVRALNDTDRSFLSGRTSAEREDRFRERIHDIELVVHFVVADIVHCSRQLAGLAIDRSNGLLCSVRQ